MEWVESEIVGETCNQVGRKRCSYGGCNGSVWHDFRQRFEGARVHSCELSVKVLGVTKCNKYVFVPCDAHAFVSPSHVLSVWFPGIVTLPHCEDAKHICIFWSRGL